MEQKQRGNLYKNPEKHKKYLKKKNNGSKETKKCNKTDLNH